MGLEVSEKAVNKTKEGMLGIRGIRGLEGFERLEGHILDVRISGIRTRELAADLLG